MTPKLCLNPEHEAADPTAHSGDLCPMCAGERLKFEGADPGLDDLMDVAEQQQPPSNRLCPSCREGRHPHDRWGANASEVTSGEHREGEDAGCPYRVTAAAGTQCMCTHVNPYRKPRKHCPTCRCE